MIIVFCVVLTSLRLFQCARSGIDSLSKHTHTHTPVIPWRRSIYSSDKRLSKKSFICPAAFACSMTGVEGARASTLRYARACVSKGKWMKLFWISRACAWKPSGENCGASESFTVHARISYDEDDDDESLTWPVVMMMKGWHVMLARLYKHHKWMRLSSDSRVCMKTCCGERRVCEWFFTSQTQKWWWRWRGWRSDLTCDTRLLYKPHQQREELLKPTALSLNKFRTAGNTHSVMRAISARAGFTMHGDFLQM